MMCSGLLRHDPGAGNRVARAFNTAVERTIAGYHKSLEWVLRHQTMTRVTTAATLVATIWLYVIIPKGFLPPQDTGLISAVTEAGPEVSFDEMQRLQARVIDVIKKDPDVTGAVSVIGVSPINPTPHARPLTITLKSREP